MQFCQRADPDPVGPAGPGRDLKEAENRVAASIDNLGDFRQAALTTSFDLGFQVFDHCYVPWMKR